jgi:DNA-binding NtrC family response regulator
MTDTAGSYRARILVVDQESWCREFLSAAIKLTGFEELKLVSSVAEALEALQESVFDLVITDPRLPESPRLIDNCRSRDPNIRFILMVHRRNQTQHLTYLEQAEIVYKPLRLDEMVRKIRNALHQKQLRQAEEELRRLKQEAFRIFF